MKIDENSINHNAVRLIKEATDAFIDNGKIEYQNNSDEAYTILGYVGGICTMANAMKEVLKVN